MTRDQTPAHNTISLGRFAKRLASAVGRFIDVSPFFLLSGNFDIKINKSGVLLYRRPINFPVKSQIGGSAVEGSQKNK
jgi:hypothetical protein